jgi:hypothetical protein
MPRSSPPKRPTHPDRPKPPSADPKLTRGKYWERERPPFDAAHSAFEATVQAQRQLVGAVAGKFGIDVKELTRGQLEAFDAVVKVASNLPTDVPDSGEPQA